MLCAGVNKSVRNSFNEPKCATEWATDKPNKEANSSNKSNKNSNHRSTDLSYTNGVTKLLPIIFELRER